MWFEVNVRLSEVTDLKWPNGTEWQCGNSTLAMSWPYQILSFASMASGQGAVKHGFLSKIAGGCSSYDVIAPWPDLTWSIFYQKLRKVCPIRYARTRRRYEPPFSRYLRKTSGGLHLVRARVNRQFLFYYYIALSKLRLQSLANLTCFFIHVFNKNKQTNKTNKQTKMCGNGK